MEILSTFIPAYLYFKFFKKSAALKKSVGTFDR